MNTAETMASGEYYESFPRLWDELDKVCKRELGYPNHSHACGMNAAIHADEVHVYESFPRLWDEPTSAAGFARCCRIIPTPVG